MELLEDRIAPATVTWMSPTGGNWDVPGNWSTNSVPGATDDVVIDTTSAATIVIQNGDAESVHTLTTAANDTLSITGGSLTIGGTAGDSTLSGPLSMTGGSLTASGSGVTVTANGTTSVTAANLIAQAGATLSLPNLDSYTGPTSFGNTLLEATGAGSTLSLPNLASLNASTGESSAIQFSALAGGTLDLSGLSQISGGAVGLESDGANSVLNVSALTSFSRTGGNYTSGIQVTNNGTLVDGKLASLDTVGLSLDGTGTLSTDQLTSDTNGSLTLSGGALSLANLSDFDDSSVTVSGGASLSFPALTSYAGPEGFGTTLLEATGKGSSLSLAELTTLNASTAESSAVQFSALAGGSVDLSGLSQISGGAVGLESDGAGSVLNVSGLTSFSKGTTNYGSGLQITNGGTVLDPELTSLSSVNLTLDGTGTLSTSQFASITNGAIAVSGGKLTLANVTDIDTDDITVSGGATLSLPAVKSYTGPVGSFGGLLEATGAGSTLSLASLTTLNASDALSSLIEFEALAGGKVDLSSLPQISGGAVVLEADGTNSVLDVSALTSFSELSENYSSVLQATHSGTILDGHLSTFNSVAVTLDGSDPQIGNSWTSLTGGSLTITGGSYTLPDLTSFSNAGLQLSGNAALSLPVLTSGNVTLANGTSLTVRGTLISMPAVGTTGATITVPDLPGVTITLDNSGTLTGTVIDVGQGTTVDVTGGTWSGTAINASQSATVDLTAGTFTGTTINAVQGATVGLTGGAFSGNTTFTVGQGAVVDLTGGNTVTYSGTLAGSGAGTVQLSSGTLDVGQGGLTLNFSGNSFQWLGGGINSTLGDVTNRGTMNLGGSAEKTFYNDGTLDNFGTIVQTGTGNFGLHSDNVVATTLKIEAGASYLIDSDSGMDNPFGGVVAVINAGTISKAAGTGTSTLTINGTLTNTGTIEAASGKLVLAPNSLTQVSGGTLTAGTWEASNGATLSLPNGTAITTNDAILGLSGAGATIGGITGLNANAGTLTVSGGAAFSTTGGLSNTGTITLGPAGILTVQGAYSQSSGATLNEQIGGPPAASSGNWWSREPPRWRAPSTLTW